MHSSTFEADSNLKGGEEVLVAIAALVTEGRIPAVKKQTKGRGFYEGPHCAPSKPNEKHFCDQSELVRNFFIK